MRCFTPEFSGRGLGIYTLLQEIELARQLGKPVPHLGYRYREPSFYDYKRQFSGTEYYKLARSMAGFIEAQKYIAQEIVSSRNLINNLRKLSMKLEFLRGASTRNRLEHLLTIGKSRVLLDCGLYQGRREESARINREFPFEPASIDAADISHAHIDHSGNLPSLVKRGFKGMIFATPATRDLCAIMLADSANIQVKDALHLAKHKRQNPEPLYTAEDVAETMSLWRFRIITNLSRRKEWKVKFYDAGHLLGLAITSIHASFRGKTARICFTVMLVVELSGAC